MLVTVWERWDENSQIWWHNHVEEGHAQGDTPTPKFPSQSGWRNGRWRKLFGRLDDEFVVRLDEAEAVGA